MKTLYYNLRLVFSGDTVLLVFSILAFLVSTANATHWQLLRAFRFCGICTLIFSTTFLLFSALELRKSERPKRTIAAALFFLAAVVICLSQVHIVVNRGQ